MDNLDKDTTKQAVSWMVSAIMWRSWKERNKRIFLFQAHSYGKTTEKGLTVLRDWLRAAELRRQMLFDILICSLERLY